MAKTVAESAAAIPLFLLRRIQGGHEWSLLSPSAALMAVGQVGTSSAMPRPAFVGYDSVCGAS